MNIRISWPLIKKNIKTIVAAGALIVMLSGFAWIAWKFLDFFILSIPMIIMTIMVSFYILFVRPFLNLK